MNRERVFPFVKICFQQIVFSRNNCIILLLMLFILFLQKKAKNATVNILLNIYGVSGLTLHYM